MEDIIEFAGDPLGNSPFDKDDPRHGHWVSASRFATEEMERFKSEMLHRNATEPTELRIWIVDWLSGTFNIRAKWLSAFFHSYNAAQYYQQTLNQFAESTISFARERRPKTISEGLLVAELQLRLSQLSAHWMAHVLKLAREAPAKDAPEPQCPTTWEDIEIRFLSGERVQVTVMGEQGTWNYGEFGFADGRVGKPNKAWLTLELLAQSEGTIQNRVALGRDRSKIEKRMQEIRRVLKKRFGIMDDPLPLVEGTGYRARFKITCSASYHR